MIFGLSDANANGDGNGLFIKAEFISPNGLANAFGNLNSLCKLGLFEQNDKFISTITTDAVAGTDDAVDNAGQLFENFIEKIHRVIEKSGIGAFYVFDCLSELLSAWATDHMIANFFQVTCPYLFRLDTVAYFALLRNVPWGDLKTWFLFYQGPSKTIRCAHTHDDWATVTDVLVREVVVEGLAARTSPARRRVLNSL